MKNKETDNKKKDSTTFFPLKSKEPSYAEIYSARNKTEGFLLGRIIA